MEVILQHERLGGVVRSNGAASRDTTVHGHTPEHHVENFTRNIVEEDVDTVLGGFLEVARE